MFLLSIPSYRRLALLTLLLFGGAPFAHAATPALFFSDLDGGPNTGGQDDKGAFVTVWGNNFGAERGAGEVTVGGGAVERFLHWSDRKIIFQLGPNTASGDIIVISGTGQQSNGIPFQVRSGRIFFIDAAAKSNGSGTFESPWRSPESFYRRIRPGDIGYFRAGTYGENYGGNWGERNFALGADKGGAEGRPVAFVGYPNETAILRAPGATHGNVTLLDSTRTRANYLTFANLVFQSVGDCLGGGGFWQDEEAGGKYIRVVGNKFSASYTGNTMTGLVSVQGDGWRIFGNEFADTGTTPPINNNHAVYIQTGADDVEVAWNVFRNLRMGHVIQVHTDVFYKYENIRIHDNMISAENSGDSRGIVVGRSLPGSYGVIYNNVLYNLGQGFSAIAIYSGDWKVYNNTLYNIRAPGGMIWVSNQSGKRPTAEIVNNILYSDGESAYVGALHGAEMNQLKLMNNLYFGYRGTAPRPPDAGAVTADPNLRDPDRGDFRPLSGSPAANRGSPAVTEVVTHDRDGTPRPRGKPVDIGAYEAVAGGKEKH